MAGIVKWGESILNAQRRYRKRVHHTTSYELTLGKYNLLLAHKEPRRRRESKHENFGTLLLGNLTCPAQATCLRADGKITSCHQ